MQLDAVLGLERGAVEQAILLLDALLRAQAHRVHMPEKGRLHQLVSLRKELLEVLIEGLLHQQLIELSARRAAEREVRVKDLWNQLSEGGELRRPGYKQRRKAHDDPLVALGLLRQLRRACLVGRVGEHCRLVRNFAGLLGGGACRWCQGRLRQVKLDRGRVELRRGGQARRLARRLGRRIGRHTGGRILELGTTRFVTGLGGGEGVGRCGMPI